ncbi:MAG: hypothetical protein ACR2MM_05710 [Flavobacteriaceae bacterium]
MKELDIKEQKLINGGHDGAAYQAGVFVGDVLEVAIAVFGGGKLLRMFK